MGAPEARYPHISGPNLRTSTCIDGARATLGTHPLAAGGGCRVRFIENKKKNGSRGKEISPSFPLSIVGRDVGTARAGANSRAISLQGGGHTVRLDQKKGNRGK